MKLVISLLIWGVFLHDRRRGWWDFNYNSGDRFFSLIIQSFIIANDLLLFGVILSHIRDHSLILERISPISFNPLNPIIPKSIRFLSELIRFNPNESEQANFIRIRKGINRIFAFGLIRINPNLLRVRSIPKLIRFKNGIK